MGKLHENLAVEKSLEQTAKKLTAESIKTLGKENLFSGALREFKMFDSEQQHQNVDELQELSTTVNENIEYVVPHIAKWYDSVLQKDLTNQLAMADIVVDGTTIVADVPATFLLGMETKLNELRKLYESIPTLAPGIVWVTDESNAKAGVFTTPNQVKQFKTEKVIDFQVVVEPTEFHPAQIKEVSKVVNIGEFLTTRWSGMMTPVEKARRLDKLDTLLVAIRKARQRANDTKLVDRKVGQVLLDFINR